MKHILRLAIPLALAAGLTACSGSGNNLGGIFGGNAPTPLTCDPGTQVQLARPAPGQFAQNVNSIEIVASGDNNSLHNNTSSWYIYATNGYQQIQGSALTPVSDTGGPHPYGSDFYYSSQLPQTLPAGSNWNVYLQQQSGGTCQPLQIQGFST